MGDQPEKTGLPFTEDLKERNGFQDVLRGVLVCFACLGHFADFLFVWYRNFFDISRIYSVWEDPVKVDLYGIHGSRLGTLLEMDDFGNAIRLFFLPWITHLFMALSGYNLARKTPEEIRSNLSQYLKRLFALAFIFFADGFLISPDFGIGMGLGLNYISMWFVFLAFASIIYSYLRGKGIVLAFAVSVALNLFANLHIIRIPKLEAIARFVHPWANQAMEPVFHLPDIFFGILLMLKLKDNQIPVRKKISMLILAGTSAALIYFLKMRKYSFDNPGSPGFSGVEISEQNSGFLFILLVEAAILVTIHLLSKRPPPRFLHVFRWIGLNSLGIFLVHRLFFVKILAPARLHIGSYFGIPMTNSSLELVFGYLPLTLLAFYFLKRISFFGKFLGKDVG
jgi:hypothetical protein